MGKTKRNSNYNNFVDTEKNNLIVIKPRKIVEQVRTFEGEEEFDVYDYYSRKLQLVTA